MAGLAAAPALGLACFLTAVMQIGTALWPEHSAEIDLGLVVTSHAMQHVVRLVRRAAEL